MKNIAFVFPGQGAQTTGMGQDFYKKFESSKKVFETASERLGFDITNMIFKPECSNELNITENTQPAILTASYAMLLPLVEAGIKPEYVAGLSLGEYTAHICAGSLTFEDAVQIVRKRGKFMQEAVPIGVGTMAAIIGLDRDQVFEACNAAGDFGIVEASNFNCPGQIVISGAVVAIEKACVICKDKGAKRAVVLPVSAPFHTSMLKNAGINLEIELKKYDMNDMKYKVVTNVDAQIVRSKEEIKDLLVKQVTNSVYWQDSVIKMIEYGIDTFIEIGPGKTLTGFLKKINSDVRGLNISNTEEFDEVIAELS